MKLTGNTILITGGASGIGLALAEAFKQLGNEVIVAGRSPEKLELALSKGLKTLSVDMTSEESVRSLAEKALATSPKLNVVIHNAGVMINEKLTSKDPSAIALQTIATNLTGPILLTNSLLPHLLKQPASTIITVTSGLAYVPLAMTPTYSATKAAVHSYTESLRMQLSGTTVEVKELIPPYVRTSLMGSRQASDENAMPLEEFISEVISILRETPTAPEIAVKRVHPQRMAAFEGREKYESVLKMQNERLMAARKTEWDAL